MIITTTNSIEGKTVQDYQGIVSGEAIVGAHVVKDFFAGMRDFFGGRSKAYENTVKDAKEFALKDLEDAAQELGANAVIGVEIGYEVVGKMGSMLMVSASGTAVKLK